jgi:FHS family L-fucose permease-like MFS transporter
MQDDQPKHAVWLALLLICATVALWGFSHRLYTTILPYLASAQTLEPRQLEIARAGLAIGYALTTLPAAFLLRNLGYKISIVLGLGSMAVGMFLFYLAVEQHSFAYFIAATGITGAGLSIIEIATVALTIFIGTPQGAIWRSNFVQALAPLGAALGLIGGQQIFSNAIQLGNSAHALVLPLFSLGGAIFILMFLVDLVDFPATAGERVAREDSTWKSFSRPFSNPKFVYSAGAVFLSLGALVILSTHAMRYSASVTRGMSPEQSYDVLLWCLITFGIGRLIGSFLTRWLNAMTVLAAFSAACVACCLAMTASRGHFAVVALIGATFFLSVQYPIIIADTLRDMKEDAKSGAAILVFVAFCGSAVLALVTLLFGHLTYPLMMTLPGICSAGVFVYALAIRRQEKLSDLNGPGALPICAPGADQPAARLS